LSVLLRLMILITPLVLFQTLLDIGRNDDPSLFKLSFHSKYQQEKNFSETI